MTHRLSSLEEYFFYRSTWNLHSCFYTAIKLNKLPTQSQIGYALQKTIQNFSQLYSNVQAKEDKDCNDKSLYMTSFKFKPIRFDDVVEYKDWNELNTNNINSIFKEYNFPYFKERPLWKLLIVPKITTLILAVDHVLSDGIGTIKFWQYFIEHLGPQIDNINNPVLYYPDSLTKPIKEYVHPYDLWPISKLWNLKRLIIPYLIKYFPNLVTGLNSQLLQFNQYQFPDNLLNMKLSKPFNYQIKNSNIHHILNVPYSKLKSILSDCKKNQVSLTSYIAAVFAIVLNSNINNENANTNNGSIFKINIPMNTRSVCQNMLNIDPSVLEIGNFVAGLEIKINRVELTNVWCVAQFIQSNILTFTKTNIDDTIQQVKLLDVIQIKDFLLQKLHNQGPGGTFEITNLGLQDFAHHNNGFIVEDLIFDEPQGISDIFTGSIATTKKGGMNICISIPEIIDYQLSNFYEKVNNYFDMF